jgi:hypothetical protein
MEIVKKNIVSILCGVVAILALVAIYWPVGGMAHDLQTKVEKSKSDYYSKLVSLRSSKRKLPVVDPLNPNAEQQQLSQFPTEEVIKSGEKARDDVQKMSQRMKEMTVEKNRHQPLLPMSYGQAPDSFAFQKAYLQYLGYWDNPDPNANTVKKLLNSVTPPNDNEIKTEEGRMWDADFSNKLIVIEGKATNEAQIKAQFDQAKEKLPERMRRERAEQYRIYLEPDAIEYAQRLGPQVTTPATPEQIWFAQNMLWIDQDVCEAVARINAKAHNIIDAPIKQLIKIALPDDDKQYITLQSAGAATTGDTAVNLTDDMLAGKAYAYSETGRISNPLYDVIHFNIEMNVDARKVPTILAELQRGKLITVYTSDTKVIDARAAVDDGYVYGDAPVVNLKLQCEELFMRGWTVGNDPQKNEGVMPKEARFLLGIPTSEQAK